MKNKKTYPKFIFTQISGIFSALIGLFFALKISYPKFESAMNKGDEFTPYVVIIIFAVVMVSTMIVSMKIWGWFLVKLGVLSKEEARGYPYSKPWEKKDGLQQ